MITILSRPVIHLVDQCMITQAKENRRSLASRLRDRVILERDWLCQSLSCLFPRIGNKNLNFTKSLAFSFLVFERMPDFKSFEHNLWGFWQNEKMKKKAQKYILFSRNVLYIEKYLSTNGDICFSRVKAKIMPCIKHFAKVVLSHTS